MADKSIDQLNAAEKIYATDLFVLQQSGSAKKLTGQVLLNWLTAAADGHGGIQSIAKLSTSGLTDTYRITLSDTTTFDFVVNNGRGVTSISKTSTIGLVDTYTISYNDGTSETLTVTNGEKGDKGDNAYVWIKYASQEPTESSHSMGDIPDDWIGIYSGNSSTAPTDWKQYQWFKCKGEKGDTGSPATLVTESVTYQASDSGTIVPSGSWSSSIPVVSQGNYLWTKMELQFNIGDPVVLYSVARMGIDGSGSVSSVAGISPDESGNVNLTADNVGALPTSGGDMTGPINMNGQTLSGLNAPTEGAQAVNKTYVDESDNQIKEDTTTLAQNIYGADPYSASVAYTVGDTCTYDRKLWECKVACSGVAPGNDTYWAQVNLGTMVSDIIGFGSQIGSSFYCKGSSSVGVASGIKIKPSEPNDQMFFVAYAGTRDSYGYGIIIAYKGGTPTKYMNTISDFTLTQPDNDLLLAIGSWTRCIVASYSPFSLESY